MMILSLFRGSLSRKSASAIFTTSGFPESGVLHVTDSLDTGGLERVVVNLANEQVRRGGRVGVWAESGGSLWSELAENLELRPAPRKPNGAAEHVLYVRQLRREVRLGRWGIVHAHQRRAAILARLASIGLDCEVVEHVHNVFDPSASRLWAWISFRSSSLIACGDHVKRSIVEDFGRDASRVTIVRNRIDLADERVCDTQAELREAGDALRILGVGRLERQKDPERFLSVIHLLKQRDLNVEAKWLGGGDLLDALRKKSSVLGDIVCFAGDADKFAVRDAMAWSDLLLLTSRWEGLPLVLLESLSRHRGVVAPDVGSCSDVVTPGRNGQLFGVDASPEEVSRLIELSWTGGELDRWKKNARDSVSTLGSIATMVEEVDYVYRRAVEH